jgi:hypothetical protein
MFKSIKPRVFLGSSNEAKGWLQYMQINMDDWCYPEPWDLGFFELSRTSIENLENNLPRYDAAVFLLTPDDITIMRGKRHPAARDNLIFEIGLAIGIIGRFNIFIVEPQNAHLKLPSDLLSFTTTRFDATSPNLCAALQPSCIKIRDAIIKNESHDVPLGFVLAGSLDRVQPRFNDEVRSILHKFDELSLSTGVIRRKWSIDLSYSLDQISENVISELITWEYELVNVTSNPIDYVLPVYSLDDETINISSFTMVNSLNEQIDLLKELNDSVDKRGIFVKRSGSVNLEPGESKTFVFNCIFKHSVSPNTHYIHNAFAPTSASMAARISATVPPGYMIDVLGAERIAPDKFVNRWDFRIPGPLLAEQVIEYIFQKREDQ